MVISNVWGVTVDCNDLNWPSVLLWSWVMSGGGLLWTVVISTDQGWYYGHRQCMGCYYGLW